MKNKYWVLATVLIGSFIGSLELVMPNVVLSQIVKELGTDVSLGGWIITIYALLFATSLPLFGKLGDMIGHQKLYLYSMIAFVITSFLCGISTNIYWLIIFRGLAGLSIAPALPSGMAIISKTFLPEERGKAMGIFGMIVAVSTGIGTPLGGLLTSYLSWSSLFFFSIPFALIGFILGLFFFQKTEETRDGKFDLFGALTFSGTVIAFMLYLTIGAKASWGSIQSLIILFVLIILAICFVISSRKNSEPFIPLRLFRYPVFTSIALIRSLQMTIYNGTMFILPLFLIKVTKTDTKTIGFGLFILSITIMIISPVVGKLSDLVNRKSLVTFGMLFTAIGSLGFALFPGKVFSPAMIVSMICLGIGIGAVQSSTMTAVSLALPKELFGIGLGVFNMLGHVGGAIGLSIFTILVAMIDFQWNFWIMTVAGVIGTLLAFLFIPSKSTAKITS